MKSKIQATNIELTEAIANYVDKKFSAFDKFVDPSDESAICDIEVGKTTDHHRSGDIFRAEVNLHIAGKDLYAAAKKDDLYAAIDEVKDEMVRLLKSHKGKEITLARRGAAKIKSMLRGVGRFGRK